jgi:WD40 repeat protein
MLRLAAANRFEGHSLGVRSVVFSRDGSLALTGSDDKTARLWDVTTGREVRRFENDAAVTAALSPDGRSVLTGGDDGTVKLWSVTAGSVLQEFNRHSDTVTSIAFSPSGQVIATGSKDGTIRLSDVTTGREVLKFETVLPVLLSIAKPAFVVCALYRGTTFAVTLSLKIPTLSSVRTLDGGAVCAVPFTGFIAPDNHAILEYSSYGVRVILAFHRRIVSLDE